MTINEQVFTQLLAEAKVKIRTGLSSHKVSLTEGEIALINAVVDNTMRNYKLQLEISPPKLSPSLNRLSCYDNKVVGYHYVDGIKRQIVQITQSGTVYYYTDGIREKYELKANK
jgi:hypothetical protein